MSNIMQRCKSKHADWLGAATRPAGAALPRHYQREPFKLILVINRLIYKQFKWHLPELRRFICMRNQMEIVIYAACGKLRHSPAIAIPFFDAVSNYIGQPVSSKMNHFRKTLTSEHVKNWTIEEN